MLATYISIIGWSFIWIGATGEGIIYNFLLLTIFVLHQIDCLAHTIPLQIIVKKSSSILDMHQIKLSLSIKENEF